jgi:hypothetical protein
MGDEDDDPDRRPDRGAWDFNKANLSSILREQSHSRVGLNGRLLSL